MTVYLDQYLRNIHFDRFPYPLNSSILNFTRKLSRLIPIPQQRVKKENMINEAVVFLYYNKSNIISNFSILSPR